MFHTFARYGLLAVRLVLVGGGVGLSAVAVRALLSVPPASSGGDGFVTGGAYLLWGALSVVSAGFVGFGVALPTLLRADDSLGFDHAQRVVLKLSGSILVSGVVAGGVGLAANSLFGMLLSLLVVLCGVLGVCLVVGWRLGEVVHRRLATGVAGGD